MNKKGLGKGLEALFPQMSIEEDDAVSTIQVRELRANPYQPRRHFDEDKLNELAQSIRDHGIIQPLVVRKSVVHGYEIVAGERRFRAAQLAGLTAVPAVVRSFTDIELMEIAIIENLQREDLNPIDIAEAYTNLMQKAELTQDQLAQRVGQSRSHVANILRLLQLPDEVRTLVSRGTLTMGHARTLLAVTDKQEMAVLAERVASEDLSVRQLESIVYPGNKNVSRETTKKKKQAEDLYVKHYEDQFRSYFGTSVRIHHGKKRGKIEIEYFSKDDLERILNLLASKAN